MSDTSFWEGFVELWEIAPAQTLALAAACLVAGFYFGRFMKPSAAQLEHRRLKKQKKEFMKAERAERVAREERSAESRKAAEESLSRIARTWRWRR